MKQIKPLTLLLSSSAWDGSIAIMASQHIIQKELILTIALIFMAGPVVLISASMVEGSLGERLFIAAVAGCIATFAVMMAAGFGPVFLEWFHAGVLKWTAAFAVVAIACIIIELPIPSSMPVWIMIVGIVIGGLMR